MTDRIRLNRTRVNNQPPANNSLEEGELFVEMGTPTRLWLGVPSSLVAAGKRLLLDLSSFVTSVNGKMGDVTLTADDVEALPISGGNILGTLTVGGVTVSVLGHVHAINDVSGLQDALNGKQPAGSYAPLSHTHIIANVSGLEEALEGKQPAGDYAPRLHTHFMSDVSGLQTALDGKADTVHGHVISDVAGLEAALAASGGLVNIDTVPPPNPVDGTLWWNPANGFLRIWDTDKWFDAVSSGLVDGSVTTAALADRAVTNAKMANMPANTFKARVSAGSGPPEDATLAQVRALLGVVPAGCVLDFAGNVTPNGWLQCAGQAVSRTQYPDLFTAIGVFHGAGDGSTTFNLPDYRGRVGIGKDDMMAAAAGRITPGGSGIRGDTLGAVGGGETVALAESNLPPHRHFVANPSSSGSRNSLNATNQMVRSGDFSANGSYDLAGNATEATIGRTSPVGSGAGHPNVQPALIVNKIIKF